MSSSTPTRPESVDTPLSHTDVPREPSQQRPPLLPPAPPAETPHQNSIRGHKRYMQKQLITCSTRKSRALHGARALASVCWVTAALTHLLTHSSPSPPLPFTQVSLLSILITPSTNGSFIYSPAHSSIHPPNHPANQPPIHPFIHSPNYTPTHPPFHPPTQPHTHSPSLSSSHSTTYPLTLLPTLPLNHTPTHPHAHPPTHSPSLASREKMEK